MGAAAAACAIESMGAAAAIAACDHAPRGRAAGIASLVVSALRLLWLRREGLFGSSLARCHCVRSFAHSSCRRSSDGNTVCVYLK